ncbi:hypothetical protein AB5J72_46300 [Streptomyces sp. CG1]|uniref:hypothetical protein n=1 Tax=Streptomyces sp. CG1 TaxID=1287523 RepID=UPI0034E2E98A
MKGVGERLIDTGLLLNVVGTARIRRENAPCHNSCASALVAASTISFDIHG